MEESGPRYCTRNQGQPLVQKRRLNHPLPTAIQLYPSGGDIPFPGVYYRTKTSLPYSSNKNAESCRE